MNTPKEKQSLLVIPEYLIIAFLKKQPIVIQLDTFRNRKVFYIKQTAIEKLPSSYLLVIIRLKWRIGASRRYLLALIREEWLVAHLYKTFASFNLWRTVSRAPLEDIC